MINIAEYGGGEPYKLQPRVIKVHQPQKSIILFAGEDGGYLVLSGAFIVVEASKCSDEYDERVVGYRHSPNDSDEPERVEVLLEYEYHIDQYRPRIR